MTDVHSKVAADPQNPFYQAIAGHLDEVFTDIPVSDITWLDVCMKMEQVLDAPTATHVVFPSSAALDAVRTNILTDFSFAKVVLKDTSVVCIDSADAAYIKTKYL